MNALMKYARGLGRSFRMEPKQPPEPEPFVCAPKPMVGLFATLTEAQQKAALTFQGNENFGAHEHRLGHKGA